MSRVAVVCLIMAISFFSLFDIVFAHKVTITSWFQGDLLHTESRFDGGEEVRNGDLEIFDSAGCIILTGKTDRNGHFAFRVTQVDDLKIVLSTPCGHKNYLIVSENEILDANLPIKNEINDSVEDAVPQSKMQCPTLEQIEFIISRQLDNRLQPMCRALARGQQKKNSLHDILGGIGYIIGLVGLVAYFKSGRI